MASTRFSRPLALTNAALILGTSLVFAWQLRTLPAQIPVHFGASGRPDRWGSPHELWFVGGMMIFLTALLAGIGWLTAKMRGREPTQHVERWRALTEERSTRTLRLLEVIIVSQNVGMAALWLVLGTGRADLAPIGIAAVLLITTVGIVTALVLHASRLYAIGAELSALGVLGAIESGYRWGGLFYYAPEDKAVFVPKRSGLGMTVNFARPQAWLVTGAALVLPLAGVAIAIAAR